MSNENRIPLKFGYPEKTGLYDPSQEKDSCGVGFVANIKGQPSHQIMLDAYHLNSRMDHRGGCGFEANSGDGAGILMALPNSFFQKVAKTEFDTDLPAAGQFAVGNIFLPQIDEERHICRETINQIIAEEGQSLVGWREVPIDAKGADVGPAALMAQPRIEQLFVAAGADLDQEQFERKLYVIRKRFTHRLRQDTSLSEAKQVYACSLSTKVIVYKGMLTPGQLFPFYGDLTNPDFETHMAMAHSRFSTNTFPSWDRAQPNRFMSHNGEINTLRGNVNSMVARQGKAKTDVFGDKLKTIFPVIDDDCSDSGSFDAVLEFMLMSGRSLPASVMMMIPEAWQSDTNMAQAKKDFYEYHSALMEPWDGPASIVFSDGHYMGAVLDRNGLRPSRYYVTHDDKVIMASEVGVVHVDPENVKLKGRLQPGKMFLLDFEEGRLIPDEELKNTIVSKRPYGEWLAEQKVTLGHLASGSAARSLDGENILQRMQAFGYTTETMQFMLIPLVTESRDPLGSMGNDSALACLSDKPRMIYDYFKQLFAQVTNPPIDSIREEIVMSLRCFIGPEGNLLQTTPEQAHRLSLDHPILSNQQLTDIRDIDYRGMKTKLIDSTFDNGEKNGFENTLDRICAEAETAIDDGFAFVIISDRLTSALRTPLSALLACGAVHQYLIKARKRTQIGLIIETGEAREVHHHCLLAGYGADAINPYLAFEALWQAQQEGFLGALFADEDALVAGYKKGVAKGILKVMAKMGISTLHSYKGAQIFEAVGLADDVIQRCFTGTASPCIGLSKARQRSYSCTSESGRFSLALRWRSAHVEPRHYCELTNCGTHQQHGSLCGLCEIFKRRRNATLHAQRPAKIQQRP